MIDTIILVAVPSVACLLIGATGGVYYGRGQLRLARRQRDQFAASARQFADANVEQADKIAALEAQLGSADGSLISLGLKNRRLKSAVDAYEADEIKRQEQRVTAAKEAGKKSHEDAVKRRAAKLAEQVAS